MAIREILKLPDRALRKVSKPVARITPTCWYVKTDFSADQVRDVLVQALDADDTVYVTDATSNFAAWHNIDPVTADLIKSNWFEKAA